ncbi:hypothetical protein C8R44DRAFT_797656 [Mycena epipterygia]|nr:hypothetical protein C8R44DRAFT_797656 [Mycena epipterygia]
MYSAVYIQSNAGRFLDYEWINIAFLREFLARDQGDAGLDASNASTRPSGPSDLVPVKVEPTQNPYLPGSALLAEGEGELHTAPAVKMRTVNEGDREIIELLSDSELDPTDNSDVEVSEELMRAASRSSSVLPATDVNDAESSDDDEVDDDKAGDGPAVEDAELIESDTVWTDNITSLVRVGNFQITKKIKAERIEEVHDLPPVWPVRRGSGISFASSRLLPVDIDHSILRLVAHASPPSIRGPSRSRRRHPVNRKPSCTKDSTSKTGGRLGQYHHILAIPTSFQTRYARERFGGSQKEGQVTFGVLILVRITVTRAK